MSGSGVFAGQLMVPSGSVVSIDNICPTNSGCNYASLNCPYYIDGLYVHASNHPYDNRYGAMTLAYQAVSTVFTNSTAQDFIITQFQTGTSDCSVLIDGNSVLVHQPNNQMGNSYTILDTHFTGTLVVPAGSEVSIQNLASNGLQRMCSYYFEGNYVHP